jgi:regulatory protein
MARRGVPEEVASRVLNRFEEVALVDDEEFARQWVHTRHAGRGLARRALAHELRGRGIEEDTVRSAVSELGEEDELASACDLVRRRLPTTTRDDPGRRRRRLASMLARKGYGAAVAYRAIRDVLGDDGRPEEVDGT